MTLYGNNWQTVEKIVQEEFEKNIVWQELYKRGQFELSQAYESLKIKPEDLEKLNFCVQTQEIIQTQSVRISSLKKYQGKTIQATVILYILNNACSMLSVTNGVTPTQQKAILQKITKQYFYLTIAELNYCFMKGVSGDFGKIYNRVDFSVVCEWLRMYDEERDAYKAYDGQNKANENKNLLLPSPAKNELKEDEKYKELFSKWVNELKVLNDKIQGRAKAKNKQKIYASFHQYFCEIHLGFKSPPDPKLLKPYDPEAAKKYKRLLWESTIEEAEQITEVLAKNPSFKKTDKGFEALRLSLVLTHLNNVSKGEQDEFLIKIQNNDSVR